MESKIEKLKLTETKKQRSLKKIWVQEGYCYKIKNDEKDEDIE